MQWDVIIVGAGPAGAALACRLRPRWRVLLLERGLAGKPAALRIGESLPGAARVLLQGFGLYESFCQDQHAERGATISQWHSDEPIWFDHLRDPHGRGWHLDRARFDQRLRAGARAAGAQLVEGCAHVRVTRVSDRWQLTFEAQGASESESATQKHHAPVVVDASGRSAAVVRQLGVPRLVDDALMCLYCHLPPARSDDDQCTRLVAVQEGWWYSVRLPSGHRVLAYHLDNDDPAHKTLRDPLQLLAHARAIPLLADVLASHAPNGSALRVHARPAGSAVLDLDALARLPPGVFAVGDAVASFDPIASQGIFHALASAESAARAINAQPGGEHLAHALYRDEMQRVYARYGQQRRASYGEVRRFRNQAFWQRRAAFHPVDAQASQSEGAKPLHRVVVPQAPP